MTEQDSDVGLVLDDMFLEGENKVELDLVEEDDFIITEDPTDPDNAEAWAAVVVKGLFKDWVVRFPSVLMDKGELEFTYEVLYFPEDTEFTDVVVANYMAALLQSIVTTLHGNNEGQIYVDPKTGEQVDI